MKKNTINRIVSFLNKENRNLAEKVVRRIIAVYFSAPFTKVYYSFNKGNNRNWNGHRGCFTLSFDCDLEYDYEAMPLLLETLDKCCIKASFACVGKWVEKFPELHRQMVDQGHEIINHSYTHPSNIHLHPQERFNQLSTNEREIEITKADHIINGILGYKPIGFRTPHFGNSHTNDIYIILKKLGYKYSSSTIAIRTPHYGNPFLSNEGIWEFPLSVNPNNILSCFDTCISFRKPKSNHTKKTEKKFFDQLKWVTEIGINTNSYINVYFDPGDIILLKNLKEFLNYLSKLRGDIWIAKYEEIVHKLQKNN